MTIMLLSNRGVAVQRRGTREERRGQYFSMVNRAGLEPATSMLEAWHSIPTELSVQEFGLLESMRFANQCNSTVGANLVFARLGGHFSAFPNKTSSKCWAGKMAFAVNWNLITQMPSARG
jgi:hypothetical protein